MLKKLFVNEWKDTWLLMAILNIAVLLLAFSGLLVFNENGIGKYLSDEGVKFNGTIAVAGMSYMFLYFVMIAVLSIAPTLFFYIRFYRNLYTDQGYLMHTLPVTSHELIWSKAFVAGIWHLISKLVAFLAVFAIIAGILGSDLSHEMSASIDELHISNGKAILCIILMIVAILGSTTFSLFMGYAAISIGQQFAKNKVLAAVGVYFGIYFLLNLVSNILSQSFFFSGTFAERNGWLDNLDGENAVLILFLVADILLLAASAGFYYITHHFMDKKLNLD